MLLQAAKTAQGYTDIKNADLFSLRKFHLPTTEAYGGTLDSNLSLIAHLCYDCFFNPQGVFTVPAHSAP